MFVGRFSWTQYKFRGDSYLLSENEYHALRALSASQLEELLCGIREDRWAEFRDSHRGLLWIAGVSAVSIVLAFIIPIIGILAFFGWVCCLSLAFTAVSRTVALERECKFYRRAYTIARQSPTYEEFCGAYLGKIASFQTLTKTTYFYSVNLYEEPIREKHAAANTFIALGWPEQWNERDELIYYPGQHQDTANAITVALFRTNSPRVTLVKSSISLKFTRRSKAQLEKLLAAFNESLQREFKKFSLFLADADQMWTGSSPIESVSPFWRKNPSGTYSLDYLPAKKVAVFGCLVARSDELLDSVLSLAEQKDSIALDNLLRTHRAMEICQGTPIEIIEKKSANKAVVTIDGFEGQFWTLLSCIRDE